MNILAMILVFIFSALSIKLFAVLANNTRLMDKPNERSMHSTPTVRGGGLIFISLPLLLIPILCYYLNQSIIDLLLFISCSFILAFVSFFDDLYQLSTKSRFFVQCLVAALVLICMPLESLNFIVFSLKTPLLIVPFIFLSIIWAINHFNFMDGIDGYCALQALFLLASYAFFFHHHQAYLYQDICILFLLSLLGFLLFNFPPAKMFMGDVGSASLGFIIFCLALIAQQKYNIPIMYWFILNGLFIFDATTTLVRRIINKEQWFSAHRKHAYQRAKQYGLSTRTILLIQAVINSSLLLGIIAYQAHFLPIYLLIILVFSLLSALYLCIEALFPMRGN